MIDSGSTVFDDYWSAVGRGDRQRAVAVLQDSRLDARQQLALVCRAQQRVGDH